MTKRVSLKTLYNLNKTSNSPLFGDLSHFEFMTGYMMDYEYFDRNFMKQHQSFCPRWNLQEESTESAVLESFKQDVYDLFIKNEENYKRLYQIVESKYNPVYNYDRHEVTIDTHSGTDKLTDEMGSKTETNNLGAQKQTNNYGEVNGTNNYGEVDGTNNYGEVNGTNNYGEVDTSDSIGAQTQTGVESIAGFNSSDFNNSDKNEQTASARNDSHHESAKIDTNKIEARTDSHHENAKTDTNKIDARTDMITNDAVTNTTEQAGYSDIHTTLHGLTITHNSDIEGNIGVTTATAMLQEHYEFWHDLFNFYEGLYQDIIKYLCTIYDDAPDAFQRFYGGDCIDVI